MPVRTKPLVRASFNTAGALQTLYTCPSGETTIVKDVRVTTVSGSPSRAGLRVISGPTYIDLVDQALASGSVGLSGLFVVLRPGDQLAGFSLGGTVGMWVSGAELEGLAD
jgi:hypothetical protein